MEELLRSTVGPGICIDLRLGDSVWRTLSDVNQLESALLNVTINARDAMPDGGRLTIAMADRSLTAADLAEEAEAKPGDYVELAVTDTGTGMTTEVLEHVFEPFFTTKPIGQGTGLGLSQIYGFVQQSGGFVRLESALAQGTTVRLYLPRHQEPEPPPTVISAGAVAGAVAGGGANRPPAAGCRVLVVDDEAEVRHLIVEVLEELGCLVSEASDGPAGLLELQTAQAGQRFDLLISDVGLPGLTGCQLADAARAMDAALPILLVTGYAGSAFAEVVLPDDVEIMHKPFTITAFSARIIGMLKGSQLA